ncbi:MAG: hypothetical protein KDA79_09015 [Planctomycetaceae bacterium]|nr:hypothetical protein [Planctomycetaceae bacterium]
MTNDRLQLWWKSLWSREVRDAQNAVRRWFRLAHPECSCRGISLALLSAERMVFLVFYHGLLPSRPGSFVVYEFLRGEKTGTELNESEAMKYRPGNYK